jgi:hypothetical protein
LPNKNRTREGDQYRNNGSKNRPIDEEPRKHR